MTEGETVGTETTVEPEVVDGGNLPSAINEATIDGSKWALNDEFQESNFKNGKLLDRFESLEELVAGYKDMSAKHANYVRDIKNGEKAVEQSVEQIQAEREATNAKAHWDEKLQLLQQQLDLFEQQINQIKDSINTIKTWDYTVDIIGLWIDEKWTVNKI